MFRSHLFRSASLGALALLPVSAWAQDADPQAQDEIVVTGENAERSL
jgi:outer membrane cobalamin receptor